MKYDNCVDNVMQLMCVLYQSFSLGLVKFIFFIIFLLPVSDE